MLPPPGGFTQKPLTVASSSTTSATTSAWHPLHASQITPSLCFRQLLLLLSLKCITTSEIRPSLVFFGHLGASCRYVLVSFAAEPRSTSITTSPARATSKSYQFSKSAGITRFRLQSRSLGEALGAQSLLLLIKSFCLGPLWLIPTWFCTQSGRLQESRPLQ